MRNLAGNSESTKWVKEELRRVGIPAVPCEGKGEVGSCWAGDLCGFTFKRAWYYYVVEGKMPLAKAEKLHQHPIAKTDVRVAGHCGCPEPAEWANYYDDNGVPVLDLEQKKDYEAASESESPSLQNIGRDGLTKYRFVADPTQYNGFVKSYHIESEAGLLLFVEAIT